MPATGDHASRDKGDRTALQLSRDDGSEDQCISLLTKSSDASPASTTTALRVSYVHIQLFFCGTRTTRSRYFLIVFFSRPFATRSLLRQRSNLVALPTAIQFRPSQTVPLSSPSSARIALSSLV